VRRDFGSLEKGPFDLLVIGGGIYGAWTSLDASLRGLRVALLEKGDWASGTSSASSKLVHGGLRYLEHLRIGLVRRSLRERSRLLAIAPHRVMATRFVVPLYRGGRAGPFRIKTGLRLYDLFAGSRNPLQGPSAFDRRETLSRHPFLAEEGLLGAAAYGDCVTDDSRFTLEVVEAARRAGTVAVNYAEAAEILFLGSRAAGAAVVDRTDGRAIEVEAGLVVNTAGPWVGKLAGDCDFTRSMRLTKGVHLVMPRLTSPEAFLFLTRQDRRVLFLIPWYGRTLLGTTDTDYHHDPDEVTVEERDVDYLFEELESVVRQDLWSRSDISGATAGLRALRDEPGVSPGLLTREWSLSSCRPGMLTSLGGKFTTARADAAAIVDEALRLLGGRKWAAAPTEKRCLPFCPEGEYSHWQSEGVREGLRVGLDSETASWCPRRYGTAVREIFALVRDDPSLGERLVPGLPFCRAEALHCARSEMVLRLEDLLRRRIPLLLLDRPARETLENTAALVAEPLGWAPERCRREVDEILERRRFYGQLPTPGSEALELTGEGGKGKKGVANQDGFPASTDVAPGTSENNRSE
jgi:glycerol-3-phosphate dehydrogenase